MDTDDCLARGSASGRWRVERLRKVARRSGARVHDLARDVVRSVTEDVTLPDDLRP